MNRTKERIIALALLVALNANLMALPIIVDFTEDSSSAKKNKANQHHSNSLHSRENSASKTKQNEHFPRFYSYNQLVIALGEESVSSDDISAEAIEIDARDIRDDSVPESSEDVFKEFPLVEEFIRQSVKHSPSSSLSSTVGDLASNSDQSREKYSTHNTYNRDQVSLSLTLDSSDVLDSLLISDTKSIPKRQMSIENKSVSAMLVDALLYLISPIPLLILSLFLIVLVLSSARN